MGFFCTLRHLLTAYTFDSALGVVGALISSLEVVRDGLCDGLRSICEGRRSIFSVSFDRRLYTHPK